MSANSDSSPISHSPWRTERQERDSTASLRVRRCTAEGSLFQDSQKPVWSWSGPAGPHPDLSASSFLRTGPPLAKRWPSVGPQGAGALPQDTSSFVLSSWVDGATPVFSRVFWALPFPVKEHPLQLPQDRPCNRLQLGSRGTHPAPSTAWKTGLPSGALSSWGSTSLSPRQARPQWLPLDVKTVPFLPYWDLLFNSPAHTYSSANFYHAVPTEPLPARM